MAKFHRGWPFATWPTVPFRLNRHSWQAEGLWYWFPMLAAPRDSTIQINDLVRGVTCTPSGTASFSWVPTDTVGWSLNSSGGTDAFLNAWPNLFPIIGQPGLTISAWIKLSSSYLTDSTDYGLWGAKENNNNFLSLKKTAANTFQFIWKYVGTTRSVSTANATGFDQWTHVVAVANVGIETALYVNGVQIGTDLSHAGFRTTYITHTLFRADEAVSSWWPGEIAEMRFYDYGLRADQAFALYDPQTRWQLYEPIPRIFPVGVPAAAGDLSVNVSDGVTVADSPTVSPLLLAGIDISDGVTVADSPTMNLGIEIAETDGVTVGEATTITPLVLGNVSVSDGVTVGEAATADIQLNITESDGVTVADTGTITITTIADLNINVSDGVTVADSTTITPLILGGISVSDGVTVGESATGDILLEITETDGVTVADNASVAITSITDLSINVSDGVTVADSTTITPLILGGVSISDGVTVGESVTGDIQLNIDVNDGATVADSVTIAVVDISDLSISVSDGLTVTDTASIAPLLLAGISVSDGITIGEAATTDLLIEIVESDGLVVGDTTTITPFLINISVTDNVTVADVDTVELPGYIIVGNPDNVAYVVFRDKRAFIMYRDKRAIV